MRAPQNQTSRQRKPTRITLDTFHFEFISRNRVAANLVIDRLHGTRSRVEEYMTRLMR